NVDNLKKLSALVTELGGNYVELEGIGKTSRIPNMEAADEAASAPSTAGTLRTNCLDLLLTTYYIDPGPQVLELAYEVREAIDHARSGRSAFDSRLIALLVRDLDTLKSQVERIMDVVQRGGDVEPPRVSVMHWTPGTEAFDAFVMHPLGPGGAGLRY